MCCDSGKTGDVIVDELPDRIVWCGRTLEAVPHPGEPEHRCYPLNRVMDVELRPWANGCVRVEVKHRLERGWLISWSVSDLAQLKEDLGVLSQGRISEQIQSTQDHLRRLKQLRKLTVGE